jgi:DNA-binding NarL/FixJ family response regulator
MENSINVLIIEDEPLTADSYVRAFDFISQKNSNLKFKISIANNCDAALQEIDKALRGFPFDLVFLDISLNSSQDKKLISGEDIGIKLRYLFGNLKIIVSTVHTNNYRLANIFKNINPEGLLIKSELTYQTLIESIENVIQGIPSYTVSVLKHIRQHMTNDFVLDTIDRQLLYHLSEGTKTKDLPEILPLSLRGVEKRKHKLKQLLGTQINSDKELIKNAKKCGFV